MRFDNGSQGKMERRNGYCRERRYAFMDRPYVHVNCASTLDGKISAPDGSRLRISSRGDMVRVHTLRQELGAVLVGAKTVISDDPKLSVNPAYVAESSSITKIVIDGRGRIPLSSRFLRTEGRSYIFTSNEADADWLEGMLSGMEEEELDAEIIMMDGEDGFLDMGRVLSELHGLGVESILVEGGSGIIRQFITRGLYDRFTVFIGPLFVGGVGPSIFGSEALPEPFGVKLISIERLDSGLLVELSG